MIPAGHPGQDMQLQVAQADGLMHLADAQQRVQVAGAESALHVAESQGLLHVDPVPNRIWRTYQPDGSPNSIYQEDTAMQQKYGQRIDALMTVFRDRFADQKNLHIKTLYMNGKAECRCLETGQDKTVWIDINDPDLQAMRQIFIEAGWKTEHWHERSAYIKGSDNGVLPFQKTTERLKKNKEKLKEALLQRLPPNEQIAAVGRIGRWQQFREFYTQLIQDRKGHYQAQLADLRQQNPQNPQIDFIQRMVTYFDKALSRFEQIDSTVMELALCSPIGGDANRVTSADRAAEIVATLNAALKAENGPMIEDGDIYFPTVRKYISKIPGCGSAVPHNNELAVEEAIWTGQLALFATYDPETENERLLYDEVRERIQTNLARVELLPEDQMKTKGDKHSKMFQKMPRLAPTRDTLDSAVFRYIMLGATEDVLNHPQFKILWDGFPVAGHDPAMVIPPQESQVIRQALVGFNTSV